MADDPGSPGWVRLWSEVVPVADGVVEALVGEVVVDGGGEDVVFGAGGISGAGGDVFDVCAGEAAAGAHRRDP